MIQRAPETYRRLNIRIHAIEAELHGLDQLVNQLLAAMADFRPDGYPTRTIGASPDTHTGNPNPEEDPPKLTSVEAAREAALKINTRYDELQNRYDRTYRAAADLAGYIRFLRGEYLIAPRTEKEIEADRCCGGFGDWKKKCENNWDVDRRLVDEHGASIAGMKICTSCLRRYQRWLAAEREKRTPRSA